MRKLLLLIPVFSLAACSGAGNGGTTGAAPDRYIGERSNVNGTYTGATSSSSMLKQRIKEDDARGATTGGGDTKY